MWSELSFHKDLITYFETRDQKLLCISRLLVLLLDVSVRATGKSLWSDRVHSRRNLREQNEVS